MELQDEGAGALNGNIYRYWAFASFGNQEFKGRTLFDAPEEPFERMMIRVGLVFIAIIQILAPTIILISNCQSWREWFIPVNMEEVSLDAWTSVTKYNTFGQWAIVLLAWCFAFCFVLYVYNYICEEMATSKKIARLAHVLNHCGHPVWTPALILGALVKGWDAISLSLSMIIILFKEDTAQGVVFDSLAMAFLLNLDDIASDLGFLGMIWSEGKVGGLYHNLKNDGLFAEAGLGPVRKIDESDASDSDDDDEDDSALLTNPLVRIPACTYALAKNLLLFLIVVTFVAPILIKSEAVGFENQGHNSTDMRTQEI
jgi:hypothetical protein